MLKPINKSIKKKKEEYKETDKPVLPSEVNILTLPFFSLSMSASGEEEIVYRKKAKRKGKVEEVTWRVVPSPKYGKPGPFDKRVFKGVEELVSERGLPVENPLAFRIHRFGRLMGMDSVGGGDYERIRESLKKLVATTIVSEGTYYLKGERRYLEEVFHLFSRVVFKGDDLPGGKVAEKTYLYLNSWLLDNLNAHYVRPLDYRFYKNLEGQISKRLYELLGVKFYGLLKKDKPFLRYKYDNLCNLLPIEKQTYPSKARQIFAPAHVELQDKNFLRKVNWKGKAIDDSYITYYPGSKAREETS